MLLYLALCIMLAYLMVITALFNVVCLYYVYFLPLTFANAFCFFLGYLHINCLLQILFCIMQSGFNQLVYLILCSHRFLMKGLYALWRNSA